MRFFSYLMLDFWRKENTQRDLDLIRGLEMDIMNARSERDTLINKRNKFLGIPAEERGNVYFNQVNKKYNKFYLYRSDSYKTKYMRVRGTRENKEKLEHINRKLLKLKKDIARKQKSLKIMQS